MHAIAYVSSAAWILKNRDLEFIVSESRGLNTLSGVTGVLLYCDGNFMQYLEGTKEAVCETYARIRKSSQHYQISELMNQPIEEREFGDWTLAFSRTGPADFLAIAAARWRGSAQTGPGAEMVKAFWADSRCQAA
ncbi:MAG: BLUF domain-containing protein [Burkholderiaceae bacterium]